MEGMPERIRAAQSKDERAQRVDNWWWADTGNTQDAIMGTLYRRADTVTDQDAVEKLVKALRLVQKYEPEYRTWGIPGYVQEIREALAAYEETEHRSKRT